MIRTRTLVPVFLSLLSLSSVDARTVYKSVDAQGNVTYSSTPPPPDSREKVEKVPIAPPPPGTERKEAVERLRSIEVESARSDRKRQELEKKRAESVSAAETELQKARDALEDAKIQGDDDWQYLARGGRVLKQSYLDRVDQAEQRVRDAEEALRKARSGRP
jgi:type IV secretory pathway VirB10-like protein